MLDLDSLLSSLIRTGVAAVLAFRVRRSNHYSLIYDLLVIHSGALGLVQQLKSPDEGA